MIYSTHARVLRWAAATMLLAAVAYLVIEIVVATAWKNPPYDWAYNLVPDLGNTACGPYQDRVVCSPLNAVMNGGFIFQGVVFGLAAVLLSRLLSGRARPVMLSLGVVHAVGLALVGVFHQALDAATSTLIINITGAGLAILAGNGIVITAGLRGRSLGLPRWLGLVSVVLGSATIIAAVLLFATGVAPPGIRERLSIYPFIVWQIVAGIALLLAARRPTAAMTTPPERLPQP